MQPSTASAGPTAVQKQPQGLPALEGERYHLRSAVDNTPAEGAALETGAGRPNSLMSSELGQLMQEAAGGPNHGRQASARPAVEGRHVPQGAGDWQAAEFLRENGWTVARVKDPVASGMTGHRGALHPDEYVDADVVRALVERELGFTYEQIRSVYRQGRLSAAQRELRGSIDARLLALSRAGGSLLALARCLGFQIKPADSAGGESCWVVEQAIRRARTEEGS